MVALIDELRWMLNRYRRYPCYLCGAKVRWPLGAHLVEVHGWKAATKVNKAIVNGITYYWISGDYVDPFLWERRLLHD